MCLGRNKMSIISIWCFNFEVDNSCICPKRGITKTLQGCRLSPSCQSIWSIVRKQLEVVLFSSRQPVCTIVLTDPQWGVHPNSVCPHTIPGITSWTGQLRVQGSPKDHTTETTILLVEWETLTASNMHGASKIHQSSYLLLRTGSLWVIQRLSGVGTAMAPSGSVSLNTVHLQQ